MPADTSDGAVAPCPLERGGLEVLVVGDDGKALEGVSLELAEKDGKRVLRSRTDEKGHCVFKGLLLKPFDLRLPKVDGGLWRVVGEQVLEKKKEDAPPAPFGAPPEDKDVDGVVYTAKGGENASVVAHRYGVAPTALSGADGRPLDLERPLRQGETVRVPALRRERAAVQTGRRYIVHRARVPFSLVLRLRDGYHGPRMRVPYLLKLKLSDGQELPHREGRTDEEGRVVELIPPEAAEGELVLAGGGQAERVRLKLSLPEPVDETEGLRERLDNLGFSCGSESGALGEKTRAALRWFQYALGLETTGEVDDTTRTALRALHGS
ncbi:peptidoglycan-binding protein [Pyxidicoccus caerfyrddinensis]|uniref:peptidoglycan-binding protein n=1 Tax=Pyxidicoccus caerfyrddinensis TaxID=2709663 RepID=UPI0013DBDE1F|nr:peptidoglycan-binding protein [Pyxidicoccus caerfyrddinensis]